MVFHFCFRKRKADVVVEIASHERETTQRISSLGRSRNTKTFSEREYQETNNSCRTEILVQENEKVKMNKRTNKWKQKNDKSEKTNAQFCLGSNFASLMLPS